MRDTVGVKMKNILNFYMILFHLFHSVCQLMQERFILGTESHASLIAVGFAKELTQAIGKEATELARCFTAPAGVRPHYSLRTRK